MKALDEDYFNEIDPIACAVLKMTQNSFVDERSIKEVMPDDVRGYRHVHFFAGAGLWAVAARMVSWPSAIPLWTGSCPCQPFSAAGNRRGVEDERHLWPDFFRLIDACRPGVVVGEQVGGKAGYGWLDGVCSDLEGIGYACWAVDIPACAIDSPQRRNRIYWVAVGDADRSGRPKPRLHGGEGEGISLSARTDGPDPDGSDCSIAMADARSEMCRGQSDAPERQEGSRIALDGTSQTITMANADSRGRGGRAQNPLWFSERRDALERPSFWADAEWLQCADGKARRAKPGIPFLVDGYPYRADLWRLAGNAIVAPLAAEVLSAVLETLEWSAAA